MKPVSQPGKARGVPATRETFHWPQGYADLYRSFRWEVPTHLNIAHLCCARWAAQAKTARRAAIVVAGAPHGKSGGRSKPKAWTYAQLHAQANRLSRALQAQGVIPGDRVALVMQQGFETAVAYMAVLQMGAVAMPLSTLFGPDALEYRLQDSEAVLAIADASALGRLQFARATGKHLRCVIGVGSSQETQQGADHNFADLMGLYSPTFTAARTRADDPAILIYTSGTTGNPKGALIPHRALVGNLSGFVCSQNWFGFDGKSNTASDAVFWSPADWAWTGGLMDSLLPTLYFGRTIVASRERFAPEAALALMAECGVTHSFLFPTALKAMMKAFPANAKAAPGQAGPTVRERFGLRLQACMVAGEAMGDAVFAWCGQQLGVVPNEMFGQTEVNYIVGNCTLHWPAKPGSMGLAYPGHRVAVIDEQGDECPPGELGEVALNRFDTNGDPDPIFFLGYWKNEAATQEKFTGSAGPDDWCRTGDLAVRDADGYLWYRGRADDVFKSSGYRIGPGEIENCLIKHPAVANAAVVPKPDPERGAIVKAYVVIAPEALKAAGAHVPELCQSLSLELQVHVKGLLAPYEYPKDIEFVESLPMTTTGKVQRRVLRLQEEERARAVQAAAKKG